MFHFERRTSHRASGERGKPTRVLFQVTNGTAVRLQLLFRWFAKPGDNGDKQKRERRGYGFYLFLSSELLVVY